jgi:hypothetical protein
VLNICLLGTSEAVGVLGSCVHRHDDAVSPTSGNSFTAEPPDDRNRILPPDRDGGVV